MMTDFGIDTWNKVECSWWGRIAVAFVLGIGMAQGFDVGIRKILELSAVTPVRFELVQPLNSPVSQGDNLEVRIHRQKSRDDCPVISFRYATDLNGIVHPVEDRAWKGGTRSADHIDMYYPTAHLPTGDYFLHVNLAYQCPERVYLVKQPSVRFEVR